MNINTENESSTEIKNRQRIKDVHLLAKYFGLSIVGGGSFSSARYEYENMCDAVLPWLDLKTIKIQTKLDESRFRTKCRNHLKKIDPEVQLSRNRLIDRLKPLIDRLRLNDTEVKYLLLALASYSDRRLQLLASVVNFYIAIEGANILESALNADKSTLAQLLSGRSRLHRCGLVIPKDHRHDLADHLQPSVALFGAFYSDGSLVDEILNRILIPINDPARSDEDLSYLLSDIALLDSALNTTSGSAHVLIAGLPGIGKTHLARYLCTSTGKNGFEVSCADLNGAPADRAERFRQYSLATELMDKNSNALLIFDEAEDVFVGDHWTHVQQSKDRHKGWTNNLLESATVPTIWITNSIERIDPAYLRRFDHVLQLRSPPRSVRRRMIADATADRTISTGLLDRIADCESFTPADAARIARVLPRITRSKSHDEETLIRLVSARPGAPSRSALMSSNHSKIRYQLEWLNINVDLHYLITSLRERNRGTLSFSGPPGTGKSALAAHIAQQIDRPLVIKKASDLISAYVGETEQRIAKAFESALDENAVLFLDEADSFLRSRSAAQRSWEVSQVNEVLAQLDSYRGVAILATNYMDSLDHAVQRRINVKLTFGYLRPEHAWAAFSDCLNALDVCCPAEDSLIAHRVRGLRNLAVGDFMAVLSGLQLCVEQPSAELLLNALIQEIKLKGGERQPIGFHVA